MLQDFTTGKFVIAVLDYEDSQYGEADYPDNWFVATKKYARGRNTEKLRKFESRDEAQQYIDERHKKKKLGVRS